LFCFARANQQMALTVNLWQKLDAKDVYRAKALGPLVATHHQSLIILQSRTVLDQFHP